MKKLILLSSLMLSTIAIAQQLPVISQFQFNRLYYNPGFAGSNEQFYAATFYRQQWVTSQFSGAPMTGLITADAPLGTTKLGLGGYAMYDHTGVTNNTEFSFALSYRIKVGAESYLSPGLKAGGSYYRSRVSSLTVWDPTDEVFQNDIVQFMPKMGFGLYYYSTNYYAGISTPDLLVYDKNNLLSSTINGNKTVYRNFVAMAGANMPLSNRITFVPSLIVKYFPNAPLFVNVNAGFKLNEKLMAGVGYRTPSTIAIFGNLALNEKIKVGYSFDTNLSSFSLGQLGSHEIMLTYGLQQ